jgi:hypothetical protein
MAVRTLRLVIGNAPGLGREIQRMDHKTAATIRRVVQAFSRMNPDTRKVFTAIAEEFSRPPSPRGAKVNEA